MRRLVAIAAVCAAACSKPPQIEDVVVRPCRIADGARTLELAYDAAGHLITRREQSSSGHVTAWSWVYDGDRVVEELLGSSKFAFGYDAAGRHVSTTLGTRQTWRGDYDGDELVTSYEMPSPVTRYTHDRYGRVTVAASRLSIGGTVTIAYEYDDGAPCKRYQTPLDMPGSPPRPPCPVAITTDDANGHRVTRPTYRDGRLVQDDDYVYSYDASGRLAKMTSLRVAGGTADKIFAYDCP